MHITQLGPLEREILEIVWQHQPATVHDVLSKLTCNSDKKLAYTTVMTIMSRLAEKDVLTRYKEGRTYVYTPAESKPQFLKSLVRATIDSLVDRYGQEALAAFAEETADLSASQRTSLASTLTNSASKKS